MPSPTAWPWMNWRPVWCSRPYRNAWSTPSMWRVFQPASWNAAPPQRCASISVRIPRSVTSRISSRSARTASSCAAGLVDQALVIGPSAILPARVAGELPVEMGGVVAQDIPDAAPVEQRRRGADHVEVDVDGLGDGPADARPRGRRGAAPPDGRTGHSSSSRSGPGRAAGPRRQAKNFATSIAWPPPSPMTLPNSGSSIDCRLELVERRASSTTMDRRRDASRRGARTAARGRPSSRRGTAGGRSSAARRSAPGRRP